MCWWGEVWVVHVSINRNIEETEVNWFDEIELQVIESQNLIMRCCACGNSFNAENIVQIINKIPNKNSEYINN